MAMTRKQINEKWDEMTPRERDTWVADAVLGITVFPRYGTERFSDEVYDNHTGELLPRYTCNISAAWRVLEAPDDTGLTPIWGVMPTVDGYNVAFDYGRSVVQAPTAPEAICLAALIAKLSESM